MVYYLGTGKSLTALPEAGRREIAPLGMGGDRRFAEEISKPMKADYDYHQPIMVGEVLSLLRPAPGKVIYDGTLGGGGHSEAFLKAGASVVASDQDSAAIAHATERLASYGDRFQAVHANFAQIDRVLASVGKVDAMFFDIGASSHHFDDAERGFSILRDGPLDMRMDPTSAFTAADVVNGWEEGELVRIFREYGEERAARRIAQAVCEARRRKPLTSTTELAAVVEKVVPRFGGRHPATRVFQSLRIAVNDELGCLDEVLAKLSHWLVRGGVVAFLSFHSLEDRRVKEYFRSRGEEWIDRPEWSAPRPNPDWCFEILTKKPQIATEAEVASNPRSRSAKLRAARRI
ncbi:MAG: 16S rRNA (cytosine(1402)-N(4))-methyltransferase RsmH [Verrucomicrobiales bacterium]